MLRLGGVYVLIFGRVGPSKGIFHGAGGCVAHAGYEVRVRVEGDGDVGVSKKLLDKLGVYALAEQERSAGVAQVVKAGIDVIIRDSLPNGSKGS